MLLERGEAKSQTDLAKKIGTTPQYISNITTGFRGPGKDFIDKLITKFPSAKDYIYRSGNMEVSGPSAKYITQDIMMIPP